MGGKQFGFSDYELTTAKKKTNREKFRSEMDAVLLRQALIDLIEPALPQIDQERRPPSLSAGHNDAGSSTAAGVFAQRPAMEEVLIEVPTMHHFAGIELIGDPLLE
jgi:IS5 family transposase